MLAVGRELKYNPRIIWSNIYVAVNFLALIFILQDEQLMGDLAGTTFSSNYLVLLSFLLVSLTIYALYTLHKISTNIRLPFSWYQRRMRTVDYFVSIHLILFIVFVHSTGLFVAASSERGGDAISSLYVILNPDVLFLIYYAHRRNCQAAKFAMLLWIFSSIQRGWFGFVFPLIAIESFHYLRAGGIKLWHLVSLVLLIVLFPLYDLVKVYVRISSSISVNDVFDYLMSSSQHLDLGYGAILYSAFEKIVGRLQTISHLTFIFDNAHIFHGLEHSGKLVPFWKEGIFGIALDRIFDAVHSFELPQAFARILVPDMDSSWNVNPSLFGWYFVYLDSFPFTFLYSLVLCLIMVFLGRLISKEQVFGDFVFFIILTLMMPGWVAQQVSFIVCMIFYLILIMMSNMFHKQVKLV